MKKVVFALLAVQLWLVPASATSIINYSEEKILTSLARVYLSVGRCGQTLHPMFNLMDLVWDVIELKAGAEPDDPVILDRYVKIIETEKVGADADTTGFCTGIVSDFGPQGRVIADLVVLKQ